MTQNVSTLPSSSVSSITGTYRGLLSLADRFPLSLVQLAGRIAVAHVFWNSAQSKLASWQVTQQLFRMEYLVPLIPPEIAAPLATATELGGAVLLFLGLLARLSACALLSVVAVIQLFVYPNSWGEHLLWASILLLVLARGAGKISVDHLISRYFRSRG